MPFRHDVVAEAGCIDIFAILINTLYLKKNVGMVWFTLSTDAPTRSPPRDAYKY
jgi:hypothetical protein